MHWRAKDSSTLLIFILAWVYCQDRPNNALYATVYFIYFHDKIYQKRSLVSK